MSASAAHATNTDRDMRQFRGFQTREEWRAERRETREFRHQVRDFRNEIEILRHRPVPPAIIPGFMVPAPGEVLVPPPRFDDFVKPSRPTISNLTTYVNANGNDKILHNGVSLDLSSTDAGITVGSNLLGDNSVTINIGGNTKLISAGSQVTAAEYAALNQVLNDGTQDLKLNDAGAAIDGALNLNSVTDDGKAIRTSQFVVPQSVEVFGDFGRHADGVRVTNDLVNYGSLYAVSTNRNQNRAVIAARDITNHAGAIITSAAPYNSTVELNPNLDLSLRADRDLNNAGSITSSGGVELTAGNSLRNSGYVGAHGDVSLQSTTITNSGSVHSTQANVRLSSPVDSHLTVNNTGGEFVAENGNIYVDTTPGATLKTDTALSGGNWYSKNLNITSGDGALSASVGDVTGVVNFSGGSIVFNADARNLNMGNVVATGDPLFSTTGDFTINADIITNGEPLSIVAGGDITVAPGVNTIDTSNNGGTAGTILIVAGVSFTTPGDLELIGPSATGGDVDLTGITTLRSGANGTMFGAATTIFAFGGTGTGRVLVPDAVITTTGTNGGGVVNVTGGLATGIAVTLLGVDARSTVSTSGDGGVVRICAGTASVVNGPFLIETTPGPTQGQPLSGTFQTTGDTDGSVVVNGDVLTTTRDITFLANTGSITVGDLNGTGGNDVGTIRILTKGDVQVGNIFANTTSALDGGFVSISTEGGNIVFTGLNVQVNSTGGGDGGRIDIDTGTGSISFPGTGGLLATGTNGGEITVVAGDISIASGNFSFNANGTAGDGGTVALTGNFLQPFSNVAPAFRADTAGQTTGGSISINALGDLTVDTGGLVAFTQGDGGIYELVADGTITINDDSVFAAADAASSSNGNGGSVELIADRLVLNSSPGNPFVIDADGDGTGDGGTISIDNGRDPTGMVVGNLSKLPKDPVLFLSLSARSGVTGGDGGNISLISGSSITVTDVAQIDAGPRGATIANGASYTLAAQTELVITGDLSATGVAGGNGGILTLVSGSKKSFQVGATKQPKNGIQGILFATGSGAEIVIENDLGGINVVRSDAVDARRLALIAHEKGKISADKDAVVTATASMTLASDAGDVGKNTIVDTPSLEIISNGKVNLINQATGPKVLLASSGGKQFNLTILEGATQIQGLDVAGDTNLVSQLGGFSIDGDIQSGGDLIIDAGTFITMQSGSTISTKVKSDVSLRAALNFNLVDAQITVETGGDLTLFAGNNFQMGGVTSILTLGGDVDITGGGPSSTISGDNITVFDGDLTATFAGNLTTGTDSVIQTQGDDGGDVLIVSGGDIELGPDSLVRALNGSLTIQNTNVTDGQIDVLIGSSLLTAGDGGAVKIAIGDIPKKGLNTTPPPNFVVDPQGPKGIAYFDGEAGSIVAVGAVTVNAHQKPVFFSNGSVDGSANPINFAGVALVEADPPARGQHHATWSMTPQAVSSRIFAF